MKGKDYTQTLEPRIYYLYVPFEDQDDIPIFDTGATSFSVSQMFRENRFTSADRIGDANQVTLALTSRLLESDSGRELLRGMIGQIYYFDDRKVTLPGGEPQTFGRSDFVGELYVNLADRLKMFNFLQWNAEDSELDQFRTDLRYTHGPGKVFNLGYYYVQGGLDEQINADLAWPLSPRWDLTARTRYSFTDDRSLESGLGIGYGACCWGLRLSALRRVDNQSEDVDSILLEFELNGLTTLSRGFGDTATVIP
jgi:LPS-assembly protein